MNMAIPHHHAGRSMMVDSDVFDMDRRLKEGDGTVGWAGDPGLWLEWDAIYEVWVVCRRAPDGREMDVTRWPPPLSPGLLIRLREADTHRPGNDPVARAMAADDAYEADMKQRWEEQMHEAAARLTHAMRKDGMDVPGRKAFFQGDARVR